MAGHLMLKDEISIAETATLNGKEYCGVLAAMTDTGKKEKLRKECNCNNNDFCKATTD